MIMTHVEISSFDELEPEISLVKGVIGNPTGGTTPRPIWRPLVTGRRVRRTMIMTNVEFSSFGELEPEISLVKGVTGTPSGGTPQGNLAPPGDLEESASHHGFSG